MKKVILTSAKITGMVPEYWEVIHDEHEGEIDLEQLELIPLVSGGNRIAAAELQEMVMEDCFIRGSLALAKEVLDLQERGENCLPELPDGCYILLPRTILQDGHKEALVAILDRDLDNGKLCHRFLPFGGLFGWGALILRLKD